MHHICPDCLTMTEVKYYQKKEVLCINCCEEKVGITVPECTSCDGSQWLTPLVPVDNDLFICSKCGLYRSGKEEHLNKKTNNPQVICPILDKPVDMSNLQRHHWTYKDDVRPETYIKISGEAHKMIHNEMRLLQQCKTSKRLSTLAVMLDSLLNIEWDRIVELDYDHEFWPCGNPPGVFMEHILIRYGFPPDFTVSGACTDFRIPDKVETPDKLKLRRNLLSKRRKDVGQMIKTGKKKHEDFPEL